MKKIYVSIIIVVIALVLILQLSGNLIGSIISNQKCEDTDGGLDYNTFGIVYYGKSVYKDECKSSIQLREYYCKSFSWFIVKSIKPAYVLYNCTYGCSNGACEVNKTEEVAYFKFDYPPSNDTFIFKLTDPVKIQEARDILAGRIKDRPHVMGNIIKKPAPYNPPWSYHLNSSTIRFFYAATEICDSSIRGVEQHLDEACGAFLPECLWCPWGSRLLEEVRTS